MEEKNMNGTQEATVNENTQGETPVDGNKQSADSGTVPQKETLKEKVKKIWNSKPAKNIRKGAKYTAIGIGGILALFGAAGVAKYMKDSNSLTPETTDVEPETEQQGEPETEQPIDDPVVEDPEN